MYPIAAGMMAGGIWSLEASFSAKGYYAMARDTMRWLL